VCPIRLVALGTHNSGQLVEAGDMRAHFAADQRVQVDCRSAGQDIGRLRP
jgi:hypothetical protein